MKLAHITTFYPKVIHSLYASSPLLAQRSFAEQMQALMSLRFGWSDVWQQALEPLGYEVFEIVANATEAQEAWLKENSLPKSDGLNSVIRQIERFDPEIIFLDDYTLVHPSQFHRLREAGRNLRLIIGWCGAPYGSLQQFQGFDLILSNISFLVGEFSGQGMAARFFDHAFDTRLAEEIPLGPRSIPLSFAGSINYGSSWHGERLRILNAISRHYPIAIHADYHPPKKAKNQNWLDRLKGLWPLTRPPEPSAAFLRNLRPAVYGREMYECMASSVATLNVHIGAARGQASNMRLFEATGMGTCLLTDAGQGLERFFEPDTEVVLFESFDECLEKVRWLSNHPSEADKIGQRGRARTLRDHSFEKRALILDEIIQDTLSATSA